MKKLFSVTTLIIALTLCFSMTAFAAVGEPVSEPVPEPLIPITMDVLPHTANTTSDQFENVDSILVVGELLALPVPEGWEASIYSDDNGSYGKIVSSNGYEIHLNISTGSAFSTAYVDTVLRDHHAPIITMETCPWLKIDDKWLYFIRTDSNVMWLLSYVDQGDWLPGHGSVIGPDEYFSPSFMVGNQRAELYGFQGPYKAYNQCAADAKMAAAIIQAVDVINYD